MGFNSNEIAKILFKLFFILNGMYFVANDVIFDFGSINIFARLTIFALFFLVLEYLAGKIFPSK